MFVSHGIDVLALFDCWFISSCVWLFKI